MTLAFLKSPTGEDPVIVEGMFKASPERMFRAWTRPEEVVIWFKKGLGRLESADIDLRIGGRWRFSYAMTDGRRDTLLGRYLAIDPGRRLEFSWTHEVARELGATETSRESHVTVTFTPSEVGTRMRLVHAGIAREDARLGVSGGWSDSFARISAALEDQATPSLSATTPEQ